jgi:hypothetical protein
MFKARYEVKLYIIMEFKLVLQRADVLMTVC